MGTRARLWSIAHGRGVGCGWDYTRSTQVTHQPVVCLAMATARQLVLEDLRRQQLALPAWRIWLRTRWYYGAMQSAYAHGFRSGRSRARETLGITIIPITRHARCQCGRLTYLVPCEHCQPATVS